MYVFLIDCYQVAITRSKLLGTKGERQTPFHCLLIYSFIHLFVEINNMILKSGMLLTLLRQDIGCTGIATVQINLNLFLNKHNDL